MKDKKRNMMPGPGLKRFSGFVIKEFYHIFRDVKTMVILFGIPVAQILIFGYVVSNEIKNINIAILDHSRDHLSKQLTQKILSSEYFQLYENLHSESELEENFKKGYVKEVLIIEEGFAENLKRNNKASVQLIADASDANTASLIVNYTSGIIRDYVNELNESASAPASINTETRMMYNEELRSVYMFVPGTIALILILVSAMMTSISIAREKEMGTMEVLLVSPLKPAQIILGKVSPYIILSFVNAALIIALSYFVFDMPVKGSLLLLFVYMMLYIILSLSIGILISTLSNSQQSAMFISLMSLMLPTMILSGFIFPIENMPVLLQWLSDIIPARWFIIIIKNIMLKGLGFQYIITETVILLLMIFFFIFLSIRKFNIYLD